MAAEDAPKAGDALRTQDLEMILEAVEQRIQKFPNETASMAFLLVMMHIGNRFSPIACAGGEWEGIVRDLTDEGSTGEPKCPNGHEVSKVGPGLKLGWIQAED